MGTEILLAGEKLRIRIEIDPPGTPVDELDIPANHKPRLLHALVNRGQITTIEQLSEIPLAQLCKYSFIGKRSLVVLAEAVAKKGQRFLDQDTFFKPSEFEKELARSVVKPLLKSDWERMSSVPWGFSIHAEILEKLRARKNIPTLGSELFGETVTHPRRMNDKFRRFTLPYRLKATVIPPHAHRKTQYRFQIAVLPD